MADVKNRMQRPGVDGDNKAILEGSAIIDGVEYTAVEINDAINAALGSGGAIKPPVADITALKALDTTDAVDFPQGTQIFVESNGEYHLDRTSTDPEDLPDIVDPTTGPGRWVRMNSAINDHNNLSDKQGGTAGEFFHATSAQNDALAGTSGSPSNSNKYVTDEDSRNSDARTPTGSAGGDLTGTYPNPTLAAAVESFLLARANHTGTQTMATISDSGALATLNAVGTGQIADGAVTNLKHANIATQRIKGRDSAGSGSPENLTPDQVNFMLQTVPTFAANNGNTGLGQLVPTGDPTNALVIGHILQSNLLEANETQEATQAIQYKDIADANQATFLDETNDKFLFPSNLNSFGLSYVPYFIRTRLSVDLSTVNNATTKYYIRLRRIVDDSIVATDQFSQNDFSAQNGLIITSEIKTFVSGEADPFVNGGAYLDILNDSNSVGTVTLQDISIGIFRG